MIFMYYAKVSCKLYRKPTKDRLDPVKSDGIQTLYHLIAGE